jgi:hypothetical protein
LKLPLRIDSSSLAKALNEKKASAACVSCGSNDWTLVPEAALIHQWLRVLPAPGIPVSVAICNSCGFVRLHALAHLGLLPKDAEEQGKEDGNG